MSSAPQAVGRAWRPWFPVFVAALVTLIVLVGLKEEAVGFDLRTVYVPAAERILDGVTPFPTEDDAVWKGHQAYVYPPVTALLMIPFTELDTPILEYVGVLTAIAILLLAVWLLGVRDPRCYAVFVLWLPTMTAWQNANVSALLVLVCALTWRFRDSWSKEGAALGLGIALKLVLWPFAIWLLATRRIRGAVAALVVAVAAILGSWAAIGFKGFLSYPDLLSMLTDVEGENSHSVSIFSGALALGAPPAVGHLASLAAGGALLVGVVAYARRGDDDASFMLAVFSALAFAPMVWLHYLALLVVPVAIYRPRFSGLWAAPLLFWVVAVPGWPVEPRRLVAAVVVTLIGVRLLTRRSSESTISTTPRGTREPVSGAVP